MFPSARSERGLTDKAYKDAYGKARGAAAKMVAGDMDLPDGLRIRRRQVEIDGKKLDYEVADAADKTDAAHPLGRMLGFASGLGFRNQLG